MDVHRGQHRISIMVRVLSVSRSGFYYWRTRTDPGPRAKAQAQAQLDELVAAAFAHFRRRYGAPRITRHLAEQGHCHDAKTVASSLRRQGLRARAAKRFKATTDSNHTWPVAENILEQDFTIERANEKWVGDISTSSSSAGARPYARLGYDASVCPIPTLRPGEASRTPRDRTAGMDRGAGSRTARRG